MKQEVLRLHHIALQKQAHMVLADISFCIFAGEIVCLPCLSIEQRDAFCNLLSGRVQQAEGWLFVDNVSQKLHSPLDAYDKHIVCIQRESTLFTNLGIAENLFALPTRPRGALVRRRRMEAAAAALLADYLPGISLASPIAALSPVQRHALELLKAVPAQARLVVFNHDLSEYAQADYELLRALLQRLAAEGIAILCVSASLGRAVHTAHRLVVIRHQMTIKAFAPPFSLSQINRCLQGVSEPEDLATAPAACGSTLLTVEKMHVPMYPCAMDLTLRAGEIVGLTDISYQVADDVLCALGGCGRHAEDCLLLGGRPAVLRSQQQSFAQGILLVGDLATERPLFSSMSMEQNIMLPVLRRTSGLLGCLRRRFLSAEVQQAAQQLGIDARALHHPIAASDAFLTQLARVRLTYSRILLLRNPFAGLRTAEQRILRRFLQDYAAEGNAVLISAADRTDLVGLCTRVYVITPSGLVSHGSMQRGEPSNAQSV